MKKILIVYRDNDTFAHYVPMIVGILQKEGCTAAVKKFPRGQQISEVISTDGYDVVIPDRTCRLRLDDKGWQKVRDSRRWDEDVTLDVTIFYATLRHLQSAAEHLGTQEESFKCLITGALENHAPRPTEILIVEKSMKDHNLVPGATTDADATAGVAQWFSEIFPGIPVRIVGSVDDVSDSNSQRWMVADRHAVVVYSAGYLSSARTEELRHKLAKRNGVFFQFPMETGITDLHMAGFYRLDTKVVMQALQKFVQEEIIEDK